MASCRTHGPAGDHIDLDQRSHRQRRHAHGGPRRQATLREVALIDRVKGRVVALERREETPGLQDMLQTKAKPASTSARLSMTRRVWASIPSGSGASGAAGSVGICPVRSTQPSLSTAWEKGATGRGAPWIIWKTGLTGAPRRARP